MVFHGFSPRFAFHREMGENRQAVSVPTPPLVNICELDCSQWPLGGSSQLVRSWQLWLVSPLPGVIPLPNGLDRL